MNYIMSNNKRGLCSNISAMFCINRCSVQKSLQCRKLVLMCVSVRINVQIIGKHEHYILYAFVLDIHLKKRSHSVCPIDSFPALSIKFANTLKLSSPSHLQ